MEPFWLGDLRPRRSARLVDIDARVYDDVLRHAGRAATALVMTTSDVCRLPPGTRAVRLADAPPVVLHVAGRRTDHRPEVGALLALMQRTIPPRAVRAQESTAAPARGWRSAAADEHGDHAGAAAARPQRLADDGPERLLLVDRPHGVPRGG